MPATSRVLCPDLSSTRGVMDILEQRAQRGVREHIQGQRERSWELGWFAFEEKAQHKESILLQKESRHWNKEKLYCLERLWTRQPVRYSNPTVLDNLLYLELRGFGPGSHQRFLSETSCDAVSLVQSMNPWYSAKWKQLQLFHGAWGQWLFSLKADTFCFCLDRLIQTNGKETAVLLCLFSSCFYNIDPLKWR